MKKYNKIDSEPLPTTRNIGLIAGLFILFFVAAKVAVEVYKSFQFIHNLPQ